MACDRPPPYPAGTRAKGWRFELDHERIRQSDTWALAPAELRPWLLMLWMVAWEQTPCGSLPMDDELIAVRIGMPLEHFQANRAKLMRGWWQAVDGRLYHDTIAGHALRMLERTEKERDRKANYRALKKADNGVDEMSQGTSMGRMHDSQGTVVGRAEESQGSDVTRTRTRTRTSNEEEESPRVRAAKPVGFTPPDWINLEHWNAWHSCAKRRKASVKQMELSVAKLDGWRKAGHDHAGALENAAVGGWQGLFLPEARRANPADVRTTTVPSRSGVDPALARIEADIKQAAPLPPHIRAQMNNLKRGTVGPTLSQFSGSAQ